MESGHRTRYLVLIILLASTLFLAGCTDAIQFGTPEYHVGAEEGEDLEDEESAAEDAGQDEDTEVNETESVESATDVDEGYVSVRYDDTYERVSVRLNNMPEDADYVEVDFGGTATAKATLNAVGDEAILTSNKLITRGEAEDLTRQLYSPTGQGGFAGVTYSNEVQVTARAVSTEQRTVIYDRTRVLGTDEVQADVEYFFDSGNDEVVVVYTSNVNADYLDVSMEFDGDTIAEARLHEVGDEVRMSANMPFLHTYGQAENLLATQLEDQVQDHRTEFESLHREAREEFRMAVRSNYEYPAPGMPDSAREKRQEQLHQLERAAENVRSQFNEVESLGQSVQELDRTNSGTYDDLTSELGDYQSTMSDIASDWDNTGEFSAVGNDVSNLRSNVRGDLSDSMDQFRRPGHDEIMTVEVNAHVAPRTTASGGQVRGGVSSEVLSYQGALRSDGYSEAGDGPVELRTRDLIEGEADGGEVDEPAVADRIHELVNKDAADHSVQTSFERSSRMDGAAEANSERLAENIDLQVHMRDVEAGDIPSPSTANNRAARLSRSAEPSCASTEFGYPFSQGELVTLTDDVTGEVEMISTTSTHFILHDNTRMSVPNYLLYDITRDWRTGGEQVAAVTPDRATDAESVAQAAVSQFDDSGSWMSGSFDTHGIGVATTEEGVVYVTRTMC